MSNEEDVVRNGAVRGKGVRKLSAFIAILVIAGAGIAYYIYYRNRTDYFTARNQRRMTLLRAQIDSSLESAIGMVRNFALYPDPEGNQSGQFNQNFRRSEASPETARAFSQYFPGFSTLLKACPLETDEELMDERLEGEPDGELAAAWVVERQAKWWIDISFHKLKKPPEDKAPAASTPLAGAGAPPAAPSVPEPKTNSGYGQVALDELFAEAIHSKSLDNFDNVFLATSDGRVALQSNGKRSDGIRINSLKSLLQKRRWKDPEALDPAALAGTSRHIDVTIDGTDYILYVEPCATTAPIVEKPTEEMARPEQPLPDLGKSTGGKGDGAKVVSAPATQWMVGALVAKRRFTYDALAISLTHLAIVTAVFLLGMCIWPFVRLSLIGNRHPITLGDAMLLTVCMVLGVSILTLSILDILVYRRLRATGDLQLRHLASYLKQGFEDDLRKAMASLELLESRTKSQPRSSLGKLDTDPLFDSSDPSDPLNEFPYVRSVAWINRYGMQTRKVAVGEVGAPLVNVASRPYFRELNEGRGYEMRGTRFMVDSVFSKTSGRTETVLSKPTRNAELPVIALTLARTHLTDADLPAGHSFAIIDDLGNVVFHADVDRVTVENFFSETDNNRQLRASVLARTQALLNVHYGGEEYRVFLKRLETIPLTLVVLRDKRLLHTANFEGIVLTFMCMLVYVSLAVILAILVTLVLPTFRAPWIWPDMTAGSRYQRLAAVFVLFLICAILQLFVFDSGPLLLLAYIVPFQIGATAYVRLARNKRTPSYYLIASIWVALSVVWLRIALIGRFIADEEIREYEPVLRSAMFIAVAAGMILVIWKVLEADRLRAFSQTLLVAAVIILSTVYPVHQWPGLAIIGWILILLVTWYYMLQRDKRDAIALLATVMTIVWIARIYAMTPDPKYADSSAEGWRLGASLLLAAATAVALLAGNNASAQENVPNVPDMRRFHPLPYYAVGFVFILITVVFPTAAFFRIGMGIEIDSFVKYGQRVLADRLARRIESSIGDAYRKQIVIPLRGDRADFFKSTWWIDREDAASNAKSDAWVRWISGWTPQNQEGSDIPAILEGLLPQYSEESVAMRELHHDDTDDGLWRWQRNGSLLALTQKLNLPEPMKKAFDDVGREVPDRIVVLSRVPHIFTTREPYLVFPLPGRRTIDSGIESTPDSGAYWILRRVSYAGAVALLFLIIAIAVRFVGVKLFLVDIDVPLWLRPRKGISKDDQAEIVHLLAPTVGGNVFLVTPDGLTDPGFEQVALAKIYKEGRHVEVLENLSRLPPIRQLLVTGIDAHLDDARFAEFKLTFLRELTQGGTRIVVLVSKLVPAAIVSITSRVALAAGRSSQEEQWRSLLAEYVCIFKEQLLRHQLPMPREAEKEVATLESLKQSIRDIQTTLKDTVKAARQVRRPTLTIMVAGLREMGRWCLTSVKSLGRGVIDPLPLPRERLTELLRSETDHDPFLQPIQAELNPQIPDLVGDRAQLLDEIRERAAAYYDALWSSCSEQEQLLLFQLAAHGFMNGSDRMSVRRLIARGCVVRKPNLRPLNESFRLYVCNAGRNQNLQTLEDESVADSTWTRIQIPVTAGLLGVIIFFFSTQRDLLNTATAVVTGVAAGLPALIKLVGLLGDRRSANQMAP